jgi:hypothetical protein
MVIERVLVAIMKVGKMKKRKKNGGWGEGKGIVVTKRFSVATRAWRLKTFWGHGDKNHGGMVIKKLLIATYMW